MPCHGISLTLSFGASQALHHESVLALTHVHTSPAVSISANKLSTKSIGDYLSLFIHFPSPLSLLPSSLSFLTVPYAFSQQMQMSTEGEKNGFFAC